MARLFSGIRLREKKKKCERENKQASKRAAGVLGQMRFLVALNQPE